MKNTQVVNNINVYITCITHNCSPPKSLYKSESSKLSRPTKVDVDLLQGERSFDGAKLESPVQNQLTICRL